MHILDTDTLNHLHADNPRVITRLQKLDDPDVGITIITRIELLRGRFDFLLKAATGSELLRAQKWLDWTVDRLALITIFPFDKVSAAQFEHLKKQKGLRKIGRADMLIASIVLANQATLVTRNVRHFQKIPRLSVVNWVD